MDKLEIINEVQRLGVGVYDLENLPSNQYHQMVTRIGGNYHEVLQILQDFRKEPHTYWIIWEGRSYTYLNKDIEKIKNCLKTPIYVRYTETGVLIGNETTPRIAGQIRGDNPQWVEVDPDDLSEAVTMYESIDAWFEDASDQGII